MELEPSKKQKYFKTPNKVPLYIGLEVVKPNLKYFCSEFLKEKNLNLKLLNSQENFHVTLLFLPKATDY
jgi:hypothetical protein